MKAQLTPESTFILPLLHALKRVGGSGKRDDIYRMLEQDMDLLPADREKREGEFPNFHRRVNYLIGNMRKAGLLEQGAGDNSLRISTTGLKLIEK